MRRDEFIRALETVRYAIKSSGVLRLLNVAARAGREQTRTLGDILDAYAKYMAIFNSFSPVEKEVAAAFNLTPISEVKFWNAFVVGPDDVRPILVEARWGATLLDDYLPKILGLLSRAKYPDIHTKKSKGKAENTAATQLTFFIREAETPTLAVDQFAHILRDIQSIYDAILKAYKLGDSTLIVGSLDSGSDKSLDIIGVASALEKLSGFFLEVWDRIRFGDSAKLSANIKAASDGVSLLTQIATATSAGDLSDAEGEKLRRTVVKNIEELLSSGVYTKEMETSVPPPPSQIPVQRIKLLGHQPAPPSRDEESGEDDESDIADDE